MHCLRGVLKSSERIQTVGPVGMVGPRPKFYYKKNCFFLLV